MLMKKVLLATDFSPPAQELVACLAELKVQGMEEVILFHAVSVVRAQGSALEVQRYYEERLQKEKDRLEAEGFKVSLRVPLGFPPEEIINTAVETGATLILMGSHGGGMIRSLFLGSTTFDVVRLSPVPVLVEKFRDVGKKDYTPVCRLKFNRILFPTDFSPCARQVWQELLTMAPHIDSVVLVSVLQRIRDEAMWQEFRDRNEQELQLMKKQMEEAGCQVETHLTEGTPSRRILEIADSEGVTLIMMPRRGEGFIQQLLLGSTAEAVARQSKQPVLLVPCDTNAVNGSGGQ